MDLLNIDTIKRLLLLLLLTSGGGVSGLASLPFLISNHNLNSYLTNGQIYFPTVPFRSLQHPQGIPGSHDSMSSKDFLIFAKKMDHFPQGSWHLPPKPVSFIPKHPPNHYQVPQHQHQPQKPSIHDSPPGLTIIHPQALYRSDHIYFPDNLPMDSHSRSLPPPAYNVQSRLPPRVSSRAIQGVQRSRVIFPEEEESSESIFRRREGFWKWNEPGIHFHGLNPESRNMILNKISSSKPKEHFVARSAPQQIHPSYSTDHSLQMSSSSFEETTTPPYNSYREYRDYETSGSAPVPITLRSVQPPQSVPGQGVSSKEVQNSIEERLHSISCSQLRNWIERILEKSLFRSRSGFFSSEETSSSLPVESSEEFDYDSEEQQKRPHTIPNTEIPSKSSVELGFQSLLNLVPKVRSVCPEGQRKDQHGVCRTPLGVKKRIILL